MVGEGLETRQPNVSVDTAASADPARTCACTSMCSACTRKVHCSMVLGAATSTSVAHASSTAIRRSEIASRSKSARAARSDATARIVGISAAVAEVRTSTTESSPGVSADGWESQSDTLPVSSRGL